MNKEKRHPNIEQIIDVLEHLIVIWKSDAEIGNVLKLYRDMKRQQGKGVS